MVIGMQDFATQVDEVITSVTNQCTTLCRYCSELHNPINNNTAELSSEDFRVIFSHILTVTKKSTVTVLFFGGEPTLRGIEWISEQINWLKLEANSLKKSVCICMSSNGELIDESWCKLFVLHSFIPGISYDGPLEISEPARTTTKSAERAIRLLREYGMQPGVMVVATSKNMKHPSMLMGSIKNMGVKHFHILYQSTFDDYGRYDEPNAEDVLYTSCYIIGRMIEDLASPVETRLRTYIERFLSNGIVNRGTGCLSLYCPAGTQTIYVHPTGTIYPCSSFVRQGQELAFCNDGRIVQEKPTQNRRVGFLRSNSCIKCPAGRICFFGCAGQKGATELECEVARGVYSFLEGYVEEVGEDLIRRFLANTNHFGKEQNSSCEGSSIP